MKLNKKNIMRSSSFLMGVGLLSFMMVGCSDFDLYKTEADYDPRYSGTIDSDATDLDVDCKAQSVSVTFTTDMDWTAQLLDEEGEACTFATVSPDSGSAGENTVTVTLNENESLTVNRVIQLQIITEKGGTKTYTIVQEHRVLVLSPENIADYDKYICPAPWNPHFENGPEYMLRNDAYYSWYRCRQSEHFFVFWSPEFGDDPNGESVPAAMKVDVDDLLLKAEKFFDTNINKLGMATLGQGMSMLDDYKMQIYLIYQDEWLATGSGYDDNIGALWVNPATCHPVGSTIAHEIGHSFQYQTYADRINKQGVENDFQSGFRYGFVGPDGAGNGGCAYWEQCAQWQAQQDYPNEQFESYNYDVFLNNCHRHFHHEWQRYASYWLQSYWVEKRGVEAYGRIWKESVAPEDAIMAYTRLFNGGDYAKTREELFDYAARMATYDIKGVREYAANYQNRYDAKFYLDYTTGEYQIAYKSCPGATGFNVIPLDVPANGGTVSVNFRGLAYGAPLAAKDNGKMVDGDGATVGTTTTYNKVGGAENMGWRYGFVAYSNSGTRTYSEVGKNPNGVLSFNVPAGTQYLFLVVQGSPEVYMSHGWDEKEINDPQFPYAIKLTGTDLSNYEEETDPVFTLVDPTNLQVDYSVKVKAPGIYERGRLDLGCEEISSFFGLSREQIAELIQVAVEPAEGIISCRSLNTDGSWNMSATANNGYWLDAKGDTGAWGGGYIYFEIAGSDLVYGDHPEQMTAGYTGSHTMRPVLTYTKGGKVYTVKFNITLNY